MVFNEENFNWKEAIWQMAQKLSQLEERVNNELAHQLRFNRWLLGIFSAIIVALTIWVIRVYLLKG